ncbi:MAG: alpha/beta fold hydrolase [Myxococcales bacterium]|nr:alpha/beta fold hydrolase [Myxococcales bacterium]
MRAWAERGARVGWANTPAGAIRFAIRGPERGQPLLLLHGLGDSLAGWVQVVGPLSRKYRVHLIDLPGHGLSHRPPDWRLETLTGAVAHYARGLREPVLVGHSLGGWIALRLVLSGAVNPSSVTLVNPAGALLAREQLQSFRALVSARDRMGVARYLERAFHRAPLPLRLFPSELIKAMWAESTQGILDAVAESDFLREAELASLEAPLRLIWGASDRLLPEGTLEFFRRALPRAKLILLPNTGHLPHLESARALVRALLS